MPFKRARSIEAGVFSHGPTTSATPRSMKLSPRLALGSRSKPYQPETHTIWLLNRFQLRFRLESQSLPESFGDDNPPGFIHPEFHTI